MKRRALGLFFALFFYALPGRALVINEVVAANSGTILDKNGDSSDWLELFNNESFPVSLKGFCLSDDQQALRKWEFPEVTLTAGSFMLIWCSGKDNADSEVHTNFKLNRDGEIILLSSSTGAVLDSLRFPPLPTDVAYGRSPDGAKNFVLISTPTPGAPNTLDNGQMYAAAPIFSQKAGFFQQPLTIILSTNTSGAEIFYTLDGSEPTVKSTRYTSSLTINKTTIIRARTIKPGMADSRITTSSYFLNTRNELNDLPVLSLVTDPDNLWDTQIGIYANPLQSGDDWERPISIEFFEQRGELGFTTDAGIRIHGGASRLPEKSAKKSFRLYFRSDYGISRLDFPIIPSTENTSFDRLVLRAGFNDAWIHWLDLERELTTYVRDPLVRDVYLNMGHPASNGDFAHLFLNGEYWGLYNISERYDDDFCDTYLGEGDWDVVKPGPDGERNAIEAAEGDLAGWNEFYDWFRQNNLASSSSYEILKSYVDLDSFIDFYILNIFSQNYDWPRHNWYAIRNRDNGRWIFLPWDSEYAFGSGNRGYTHTLNMWDVIESQSSYPLPLLYGKLLNNTLFRNDVAARFFELWTTWLSQDHLLNLLNTRLDQIRTAIPFEAERWGDARSPDIYDYDDWLAAGEHMKSFIQNRTAVLMGQLAAKGFETPGMDVPDGWRNSDIGDVAVNGFAFYHDGIFTINGSGFDIWNTEDEFFYVWKTVPGDVDIRARVISLTNTDAWAKAGIMIRETLNNTSKNVYVALTPDKVTFQRRDQSAGLTASTKIENRSAPHWVRLQRQGDVYTAYESADGLSWNQVDQSTFSLRQNAMVGLAVTSHNDGVLCTATFDHVTINGIMADTADNIDLPADFTLLQNYPNPFNPQTTIEIVLGADEHVNLAVYNVRGTLVRVLLSEHLAAGVHQIPFHAPDLASGIYIAKLEFKGRAETIKMLLVH
ncbi:DUF1349 domain-containing protein [candidate division KSB1 bacterium]|nr:CotH kinase family protein [candidate division KSB1 bacterium]RQW03393.1 MAG: DUF1349 domain-containing protein [candidate division KSB1 bacterium]